jgi:hypothetical protein
MTVTMQGSATLHDSFHGLVRTATAAVALATVGVLASATPARGAGPITLTQKWFTNLNDAPCGVAMASPAEASLDGTGPSVEVGDRSGHLYAFHISSTSQTPSSPTGWTTGSGAAVGPGQGCGISGNDGGLASPATGVDGVAVPGNPPIDSTASALTNNGTAELFFGAGNAAESTTGGYFAYGANATIQWNQVVQNPPGSGAGVGVQASLSMGQSNGTRFVNAGALGQETYSLNTANGVPLAGWPAFTADSVFSTAAVGDLYGTGHQELVAGGASTAGIAFGTHYQNGGHLRIFNDHGGLICAANTNEEVDSSPAVGPILPGGAFGIAVGTGSFFGGSDENTVKVFDTQCHQVWSAPLDGTTGGSPALADVQGSGQLAVVEGTNVGRGAGGSVWALNSATGATIWHTHVIGAVIGSVTTADLAGNGTQDVIVPTIGGLEILDGATGTEVADVDDGSGHGGVCGGCVYGFQNAPLVTADPDGTIGITVAGYFAIAGSTNGDVQGMVQHFSVVGSNGALVGAARGWPQFHHDPSLSGFTGLPSTLPGGCQRPPAASNGYLTVASDGGVFTFGGQPFCGSTGSLTLNKPVLGIGQAPDQGGYWLVAADGGIFTFGSAQFYGSTGSITLNKPIVGMAVTPDAKGYWLVAADGGIFTFGDAAFYGTAASTPNQNVVGMAASPDGQGYWEVTTSGRVFAFGDAAFAGDASHFGLQKPIVGITADPVTGGYWLVGGDGGIFSFNAPFFGSTGNIHLNQPVVGMQATDDGGGYWFVAADGGIFAYGDAPFSGSTGNIRLNRPMVGMVGF